jgi:hypothetical protein
MRKLNAERTSAALLVSMVMSVSFRLMERL